MASKHLWKTKIATNDSTAQEQIGALRREWNTTDDSFKTYRYVHIKDDTTVVDGTTLTFEDIIMGTVTSDITDADRNQPAGVGRGAITASYYGWIQVGGYHSAVLSTPYSISDGDWITIHNTEDGYADAIASGNAITTRPLGIAVVANSGSAVATYLTLNEMIQ